MTVKSMTPTLRVNIKGRYVSETQRFPVGGTADVPADTIQHWVRTVPTPDGGVEHELILVRFEAARNEMAAQEPLQ